MAYHDNSGYCPSQSCSFCKYKSLKIMSDEACVGRLAQHHNLAGRAGFASIFCPAQYMEKHSILQMANMWTSVSKTECVLICPAVHSDICFLDRWRWLYGQNKQICSIHEIGLNFYCRQNWYRRTQLAKQMPTMKRVQPLHALASLMVSDWTRMHQLHKL